MSFFFVLRLCLGVESIPAACRASLPRALEQPYFSLQALGSIPSVPYAFENLPS